MQSKYLKKLKPTWVKLVSTHNPPQSTPAMLEELTAEAARTQLAKSQHLILHQLKTRGPQSVKILAKQLEMTTMGIRQHLSELETLGLIEPTAQEKQTRGRPVKLWRLSMLGNEHFPQRHADLAVDLITVLEESLGADQLEQVIIARADKFEQSYQMELEKHRKLDAKIQAIARLRSEEGFMAEVRLLPDGWLLIENHCPISSAAKHCQYFCSSELQMFQHLLEGHATIERIDHILGGARRCAYKICSKSAGISLAANRAAGN